MKKYLLIISYIHFWYCVFGTIHRLLCHIYKHECFHFFFLKTFIVLCLFLIHCVYFKLMSVYSVRLGYTFTFLYVVVYLTLITNFDIGSVQEEYPRLDHVILLYQLLESCHYKYVMLSQDNCNPGHASHPNNNYQIPWWNFVVLNSSKEFKSFHW